MILSSEKQLGDMVEDGRITPDDADEVRDFATLLSKMGPPGTKDSPRRYRLDELVALEEYSHDRDPEFAARLRQRINERRSRDGC